jgi:hypothetical protein
MSTIGVFPESDAPRVYRAVSGQRQAVGATVGDAVKNLTDQLGEPEETTLVVVQPMKPDRFFTAEQIRQLSDLMAKWRAARDAGGCLAPDEQAELERLVQAELAATIERSKALLERSSQ